MRYKRSVYMNEVKVNQANKILSEFLVSQRMRARLTVDRVASLIGETPTQIQSIEARPIKAPLNQIAKLVELYRTDPIAFHQKLHLVSATIQKQ